MMMMNESNQRFVLYTRESLLIPLRRTHAYPQRIRTLAAAIGLWVLLFTCTHCSAQEQVKTTSVVKPDWSFTLDTFAQWNDHTEVGDGMRAEQTRNIGGKFDLMGNGALLLQKAQPEKEFCKVDHFKKKGVWTSKWIPLPAGHSVKALKSEIIIYGKQQDMSKGWVKFKGNPLICGNGWKHATEQSLQLPESLSDSPADQSLVRGRGKWEGKWLLLFNIGGWAKKGWGMAVADSLEPLQRGINPFKLAEPYPLFKGTGGKNAPNDWIEVAGTWYAPDESRGGGPHMWTSTDLVRWKNQGPIKGINGHDPGMCFDGERYYLFNEYSSGIRFCSATDPLGQWTPHGVAFSIGSHCGDADVSFFNNRWHMTFDDAPHRRYQIGYASTTPSQFPKGWKLQRKIFGPHNPDQGQRWDDATGRGNKFGTGDADLALEGTTLYMTYEQPVGIAYKRLEVFDGSKQQIRVRVEADNNDDGNPDNTTGWHTLTTGKPSWDAKSGFPSLSGKRVRISFSMDTQENGESPMITQCSIVARPNVSP